MFEFLFITYRHYLQHAIIFGLFVWAMRRGDQPEKWAAAVLVGIVLADYAYHFIFPQDSVYGDVNFGHLVIDVAAVVALVPLSMRANRIYPLWLSAAQIIMVAMHFYRALFPAIDPIAYYLLTRAPSFVMVIALLCGMIAHRRRVRRGISAPPWRRSSAR